MSKHKETSDSLSHPVVEPAHIVVPARRRTAGDYVALGLATCGVGLIPIAPGTWGSAVGVVLYLGLGRLTERVFDYSVARGLDLSPQQFPAILTTVLLLVILAVSLAGMWAASRAEKLLGKKDPGAVVVDEVAGQLITFLFVPWLTTWTWSVVVGFVAFRVFDIWKPYPVRRLEGLGGGLGIMADDMLAGFYAATVMSLLVTLRLLYY
ncbi:MAG: phosphatidylglycerophosphatase [Acidobacteriota bacterium]|jgi:phosphatidylglycerophosphatase A|nr:phosphatidylglycerophosphatase [Acidobacteriota bacterium]